ncbi:hypothetical protein EGY25_14370 [Brevundimonas intermedia]|uniref:Uncharacterized protein n=1 Tax=Brevundimonas intermedia TaxID=74315 RepID=A0A4Y9RNN6_9CAUL|nr:hypothetical protein [Brevundimonas intermedia]TFW10887.1 hypothetical protein EGY25_14370 [Brevundimonas intermedia]
MTRMGLVAFLFSDCLDSVSRTTRLAKYADDPGGRDYHWAAKLGAQKMFGDDVSYDQAVADTMSKISRSHQRLDNQEALKGLYGWKIANPGVGKEPPSGELAGPKGELIVSLKPCFAVERKGVTTAYVPWMFKEVRLTAQVASIGVHLLEVGLQKDAYSNWRFALIDTVTQKCFWRTHKHSAKAANFAIRTTEEILIAQRVKKAA